VANTLVPIEVGTPGLMSSGVASANESGMLAAVSYATAYARRQHEELTWHHDAGQQAKYLEQPINSEKPKVEKLIAREVKKALG
jgi:hypothetical protein